MGATASYLIFCDPAPTSLGLRTEVELLRINHVASNANDFRVTDKPHVFLNKGGFDIGPVTTDLIEVVADLTLEGNANRGFRIYVCIEGVPGVGVESDPLRAKVSGGHALLNGSVRLGDQDQDCGAYLDAMLQQEEDRLEVPAAGLMSVAARTAGPVAPPASASPKKSVTKSETAAIIKKLLKP